MARALMVMVAVLLLIAPMTYILVIDRVALGEPSLPAAAQPFVPHSVSPSTAAPERGTVRGAAYDLTDELEGPGTNSSASEGGHPARLLRIDRNGLGAYVSECRNTTEDGECKDTSPGLFSSAHDIMRSLESECGASINASDAVGVAPGGLDVVITFVNFTASRHQRVMDETDLRNSSQAGCEPNKGIFGAGGGGGRCSHLVNTRSCCVRFEATAADAWGVCQAPDHTNKDCACEECFDYRLRRPEQLFDEVRFMLRSFEANGLYVQSDEHPNGLLGTIYILYNTCEGNGAPAYIRQPSPKGVVMMSYEDIWPVPSQLPTGNRNAIAAALHRIPGLGPWFLYLEDDMFLNRPFERGYYFDDDGRLLTRLTKPQGDLPGGDGWMGASLTSLGLLSSVFGERLRYGESLHHPKMMNTCVMKMMTEEIWPERFAATMSRREQHPEDAMMLTHFGMLMEDIGRARNVPCAGSFIRSLHVNAGDSLTQVQEMLYSCCYRDTAWIHVQGDGLADEYVAEMRSPRGDVRREWIEFLLSRYPAPSSYETAPDTWATDPAVIQMGLREAGSRKYCQREIPIPTSQGYRRAPAPLDQTPMEMGPLTIQAC